MARRPGHILPFRIPFFRIFYSTTYTTIYIIEICLLAITPVSLIWAAIETQTYQYTFMIGGTYVVTALIAIFIYSSRLYTNRTALASVGKTYIPVEDGELGKGVRKMIVKQLERSAILAWETRPRDLMGEILQAQREKVLPPDTTGVSRHDYTVGKEVSVDPDFPPWGPIEHAGWSSPETRDDDEMPHLQFATVIKELPNLVEAKAVSLAPADPDLSSPGQPPIADMAVAEVLRRPETMGMRDYLTQLSYLGLENPSGVAQDFLSRYERARFSGLPVSEVEFRKLMTAFAQLLSGMTALDPAIIEQIRKQVGLRELEARADDVAPQVEQRIEATPSRSKPEPAIRTPVSPGAPLHSTTLPDVLQQRSSLESVGSVVHQTADADTASPSLRRRSSSSRQSSAVASSSSDAGSVIRHASAGGG